MNNFLLQQFVCVDSFKHKQIFKGIEYPWQILSKISQYTKQYIAKYPHELEQRQIKMVGLAHIGQNVIIGKGTQIEHGAMIKGPALIGQNCTIRKGAYIRENVIVGNDCLIGNSCEIKNSIIFNQAQIAHFNYIGDSLLGYKSHFAAGAITSNLKLDSSPITISANNLKIETNLQKFGAIVGDFSEIGCNAVLNPGSLIGKSSIVYPQVSFRGYLPSGSICKLIQSQQIVERK